MKIGHDNMVKKLTDDNVNLKRKLTSLNYSKYRVVKEKKDLIGKCKSQSDTLAKFAKSKQELDRLLSLNQKPSNNCNIHLEESCMHNCNIRFIVRKKSGREIFLVH